MVKEIILCKTGLNGLKHSFVVFYSFLLFVCSLFFVFSFSSPVNATSYNLGSDSNTPLEVFDYMNTDSGQLVIGSVQYTGDTSEYNVYEDGVIKNYVEYYVCPRDNNSDCILPGTFELNWQNIGMLTYYSVDSNTIDTLTVDTSLVDNDTIYAYIEVGLEGFSVDTDGDCPFGSDVVSGSCTADSMTMVKSIHFNSSYDNLPNVFTFKNGLDLQGDPFVYSVSDDYSNYGGLLYLKRIYYAYDSSVFANIPDPSSEFPFGYDSNNAANNEYMYDLMNNLQPVDAESSQHITSLLSVFSNFLGGFGNVTDVTPVTVGSSSMRCPVSLNFVTNSSGTGIPESSPLGFLGTAFNGGIQDLCNSAVNKTLWQMNEGSSYFPNYSVGASSVLSGTSFLAIAFVGCFWLCWMLVKGLYYTIVDAVDNALDFGGNV